MPDDRRWLTRGDFPDWALVEASMLGGNWSNHCDICRVKIGQINVKIGQINRIYPGLLCLVGAAAWILEGDSVPVDWLSPEDQRELRTV